MTLGLTPLLPAQGAVAATADGREGTQSFVVPGGTPREALAAAGHRAASPEAALHRRGAHIHLHRATAVLHR